MANCSVAGIPLAYINNFIQIWCGTPFYSMLYGSNSHQMYLELQGPPFESSGRKYIWIILQRSNTNDSRTGFNRIDCNLWQFPALACRMIWIYIHSVLDGGLQCAVMGNRYHLKPTLRCIHTDSNLLIQLCTTRLYDIKCVVVMQKVVVRPTSTIFFINLARLQCKKWQKYVQITSDRTEHLCEHYVAWISFEMDRHLAVHDLCRTT